MGFTWRNCKTDPPSEDKSELFLTDGEKIYKINYSKTKGFFDSYVERVIPEDWLGKLWWAQNEWIKTPSGWVRLYNLQEVKYD